MSAVPAVKITRAGIEVNEVPSDLSALEARVAANEARNTEQDALIASNGGRIGVVEGNVSNLFADTALLDSTIGALDAIVRHETSGLDAVKTALDALRNDHLSNVATLLTINESLGELRNTSNLLSDSIDAANTLIHHVQTNSLTDSDLTSLRDRASALEASNVTTHNNIIRIDGLINTLQANTHAVVDLQPLNDLIATNTIALGDANDAIDVLETLVGGTSVTTLATQAAVDASLALKAPLSNVLALELEKADWSYIDSAVVPVVEKASTLYSRTRYNPESDSAAIQAIAKYLSMTTDLGVNTDSSTFTRETNSIVPADIYPVQDNLVANVKTFHLSTDNNPTTSFMSGQIAQHEIAIVEPPNYNPNNAYPVVLLLEDVPSIGSLANLVNRPEFLTDYAGTPLANGFFIVQDKSVTTRVNAERRALTLFKSLETPDETDDEEFAAYYNYIIYDLLPFVGKTYAGARTDRDNLVISGYSWTGSRAINLAFKFPHLARNFIINEPSNSARTESDYKLPKLIKAYSGPLRTSDLDMRIVWRSNYAGTKGSIREDTAENQFNFTLWQKQFIYGDDGNMYSIGSGYDWMTWGDGADFTRYRALNDVGDGDNPTVETTSGVKRRLFFTDSPDDMRGHSTLTLLDDFHESMAKLFGVYTLTSPTEYFDNSTTSVTANISHEWGAFIDTNYDYTARPSTIAVNCAAPNKNIDHIKVEFEKDSNVIHTHTSLKNAIIFPEQYGTGGFQPYKVWHGDDAPLVGSNVTIRFMKTDDTEISNIVTPYELNTQPRDGDYVPTSTVYLDPLNGNRYTSNFNFEKITTPTLYGSTEEYKLSSALLTAGTKYKFYDEVDEIWWDPCAYFTSSESYRSVYLSNQSTSNDKINHVLANGGKRFEVTESGQYDITLYYYSAGDAYTGWYMKVDFIPVTLTTSNVVLNFSNIQSTEVTHIYSFVWGMLPLTNNSVTISDVVVDNQPIWFKLSNGSSDTSGVYEPSADYAGWEVTAVDNGTGDSVFNIDSGAHPNTIGTTITVQAV